MAAYKYVATLIAGNEVSMNTITLAVGVFVGMYIGNPQFKEQADNTIKQLIGQGINTLNAMDNPSSEQGGDSNVHSTEKSHD